MFKKLALIPLILSFLYAKENSSCCPPGAVDYPSQVGTCYKNTYSTLRSAEKCPCEKCTISKWSGKTDLTLLVFQAKEDGLNFAFQNNPQFKSEYSTDSLFNDINGNFVNMSFRWMPAFKINMGFQTPKKAWDTNFRWTYFHSTNSKSVTSAGNISGLGLFPIWVLPNNQFAINNPILFRKASSSWNLTFNTIDWELGLNSLLTKHLSSRLFMGLKGAIIDQSLKANYSDGVLFPNAGFLAEDATNSFQPISANAKMKNNAYGVGPRLGLQSMWRLGKGLSFLADISGALPFYHFILKRQDEDVTNFPNIPLEETIRHKLSTSIWTYRPNLETNLGLAYSLCFGKKNNRTFGTSLSYEMQYFWEQNMMSLLVGESIQYIPFAQRGDLILQGVNINFRFGY